MTRLLPALLLFVLVAAAGVALADPAVTPALHACALPGDGWMRLVDDPADCTAWETAVSWNQAGPAADPCTVAETGEQQFTLTCPDGTSVTWSTAPASEPDSEPAIGGDVACVGQRPEPWSNYRGCDFAGMDLSGMFLFEVDLSGANLRGTDLGGTVWWNVDASNADLSGGGHAPVNLSDADLTGVDLSDARLDFAILTNLSGEEVNLRNASLYRVEASNVDFADSDLSGTDFRGADLSDGDFTGVDLTGADLGFAFLWDADFTDADMSGARGLDTADWGDATCPDGSIASMNGGTCLGHLGAGTLLSTAFD